MPRIPAAPARRGYLFKGLGLVAVAVVSGLIWWLIRHEPGTAPGPRGQAREFAFTAAEGPVATTDCPGKSTGEVKRFFGTRPCQQLARALFTTTAAGGAQALVSVAVVTMPDIDQAQQLKTLVDTDDTGNVIDLGRDGTAKLPGAPRLVSGTYASRLSGTRVTIVLADFFGGHKDDTALARLSAEALDLAPQVTG